MSTVVTSQPRAQEDSAENQDEVANTSMINNEEIEAQKKKTENIDEIEDTCCFVLDSTEDIWCLCQCIAWCFRSLGHCTENCCEDCAECISDCCENSGDTSVQADDGCFCCDCDCSD